jgi:hypothetical protein
VSPALAAAIVPAADADADAEAVGGDRPDWGEPGSIRPTAMRERVASIVQEHRYTHPGAPVPCDGHGWPAGALERGEFAKP